MQYVVGDIYIHINVIYRQTLQYADCIFGINAVARAMTRATEHSSGPTASSNTSLPGQRPLSTAGGSSVRGASAHRPQRITTQFNGERGPEKHSHSPHVNFKVGESSRDRRTPQRRSDEHAERSPTHVRYRSPRVGAVRRRSPTPPQRDSERHEYVSPFQVCHVNRYSGSSMSFLLC